MNKIYKLKINTTIKNRKSKIRIQKLGAPEVNEMQATVFCAPPVHSGTVVLSVDWSLDLCFGTREMRGFVFRRPENALRMGDLTRVTTVLLERLDHPV